jgi:hypothetical protein
LKFEFTRHSFVLCDTEQIKHKPMKQIIAPSPFRLDENLSVFLAGSIEGDTAERWQDIVVETMCSKAVTFLNPRRTHWDASWKSELSSPPFKAQVD